MLYQIAVKQEEQQEGVMISTNASPTLQRLPWKLILKRAFH